MTPREFLQRYRHDARLVTGGYYPQEPVALEAGDVVGVVMMSHGGPGREADIEPFLYRLFMDPALIDLPVPGALRDWMSRLAARRRARSLREDYRQIGGGSPANRLALEQAHALEARLNGRLGPLTGAAFRTYVATRYWEPSSQEAAGQMQADGVTKVVLLPLFPQYSKTTTGSSVLYWKAAEEAGEIPAWPTSLVREYATHPLFVQALGERIDEGLQRFPRSLREHVHLVFSAHGTPLREMKKRRDPYCCLIHATVQAVMDLRAEKEERPFRVAFQSKIGPGEGLTPSTRATIEELAAEGQKAVLLVPVTFVSEHAATAFELDIALREEALRAGIEHYEVTSGLNCHPLFIEALAEVVAAQVAAGRAFEGDGAAGHLPPPVSPPPRLEARRRSVRCHQCGCITEARDWSRQAEADEVDEVHVSAEAARRSP